METSKHEKIVKRMQQERVDSFLVTNLINIRYLTGFTGISAYMVIKEKEVFFITDFTHITDARNEIKDCEVIELKQSLSATLEQHRQRLDIRRLGFEMDTLPFNQYLELTNLFSERRLVPVKGCIEKLRSIKSPLEIARIDAAIRLSLKAFQETRKYIKPGIKEYEVAAEYEYRIRKMGASGRAFETIIASGHRGALPHGMASSKTINENDVVVCDFGCVLKQYCSDNTRTISLGEPPERYHEIYQLVEHAKQEATRSIKPGMLAKDVDKVARDIINDAGYGELFGHGTGHSVGMEVHDYSPRLSPHSETELVEGMVFSIEPGIYFPGRWGVRIEDLVTVTSDGCRVLGID